MPLYSPIKESLRNNPNTRLRKDDVTSLSKPMKGDSTSVHEGTDKLL